MLYSMPPARARGPNTASSIVVAVEMPYVAAAVAQANPLDVARVGVERLRVVCASRVVETDLQSLSGFGVRQVEQSVPAGLTIFVGPDLDQNQLMAEVGQVLQGPFTARVVQKVGNDDQQPALRIGGDEVARNLKIVGAAAEFELLENFHCRNKAVPAASAQEGIRQFVAEGLDADGVQPHQAYVA